MSDPRGVNSKQAESPLKRRGLLIGASVAGVGAIAAKALPPAAPEAAALALTAPKAVDSSGGYQVTAHVLRYYETARA
jgi:hypothetical protein